jgi:capsular polysaccharide biosynthesis protein
MAEEQGFTGTYIVPPHAYARETLMLAGIAPERIVIHTDGVWKVGRLYVSQHLEGTSLLHHPELLLKLRAAMLRSVPAQTARRRVYISRNRPGMVRQILNEPEFKAFITKFGFEDYFCEDHPIAEQVSFFTGCEAAIGSDGAGFVNALYMPEGSLVIALLSPLRWSPGGTLLPNKLLRHRYFPLMPYVTEPYPHGEDVVANLDMIEATLERELG